MNTNTDYKAIANWFTYYYNMWKNNKLTFDNPDDEDNFFNAVCILWLYNSDAVKNIPEDVKMRGDAIIERELKKLKEVIGVE